MQSFGELVREARRRKGISVHSLAQELQKKPTKNKKAGGALTMIEQATRPPTLTRAMAIYEVLQLQDKEEVLKAAFVARIKYAIQRERENLNRFLAETSGLEIVDPRVITDLSPKEIKELFT